MSALVFSCSLALILHYTNINLNDKTNLTKERTKNNNKKKMRENL